MTLSKFVSFTDWIAIIVFFGCWLGYIIFARYWCIRRPSLVSTSNRYRRAWMFQTTVRDPRMLDSIIAQNLAQTPAFFSSTTIIIIGGLFALLGTTDRAAEIVREIPFAVQTTVILFDIKVLVLIGIFIYAFFRFTWSMRQYTYVALTIGSMPPAEDFESGKFDRNVFAERAGKMASMAVETFNDGVRAYYFSFAAISWFFSPWALMVAAVSVTLILYNREFRSTVLAVLRD